MKDIAGSLRHQGFGLTRRAAHAPEVPSLHEQSIHSPLWWSKVLTATEGIRPSWVPARKPSVMKYTLTRVA